MSSEGWLPDRRSAVPGSETHVDLGRGSSRLRDRPARDRAKTTHVDAPAGRHADAGSIHGASTIFAASIICVRDSVPSKAPVCCFIRRRIRGLAHAAIGRGASEGIRSRTWKCSLTASLDATRPRANRWFASSRPFARSRHVVTPRQAADAPVGRRCRTSVTGSVRRRRARGAPAFPS